MLSLVNNTRDMGDTRTAGLGWKNKFGFGHIEFDVPARWRMEDVLLESGNPNLKVGRKAKANDKDLLVITQ